MEILLQKKGKRKFTTLRREENVCVKNYFLLFMHVNHIN